MRALTILCFAILYFASGIQGDEGNDADKTAELMKKVQEGMKKIGYMGDDILGELKKFMDKMTTKNKNGDLDDEDMELMTVLMFMMNFLDADMENDDDDDDDDDVMTVMFNMMLAGLKRYEQEENSMGGGEHGAPRIPKGYGMPRGSPQRQGQYGMKQQGQGMAGLMQMMMGNQMGGGGGGGGYGSDGSGYNRGWGSSRGYGYGRQEENPMEKFLSMMGGAGMGGQGYYLDRRPDRMQPMMRKMMMIRYFMQMMKRQMGKHCGGRMGYGQMGMMDGMPGMGGPMMGGRGPMRGGPMQGGPMMGGRGPMRGGPMQGGPMMGGRGPMRGGPMQGGPMMGGRGPMQGGPMQGGPMGGIRSIMMGGYGKGKKNDTDKPKMGPGKPRGPKYANGMKDKTPEEEQLKRIVNMLMSEGDAYMSDSDMAKMKELMKKMVQIMMKNGNENTSTKAPMTTTTTGADEGSDVDRSRR